MSIGLNRHGVNVRFTGRDRAPQAIKRLLRNLPGDPLRQLLKLGAMTISKSLLASARALEVAFEPRSAEAIEICRDSHRIADP